MKTKDIDLGIITAFFKYEVIDNTALIHELRLGGGEAVKFPLTDWWDAKNFSKLLSDEICMDVEALEVGDLSFMGNPPKHKAIYGAAA